MRVSLLHFGACCKEKQRFSHPYLHPQFFPVLVADTLVPFMWAAQAGWVLVTLKI